MHRNWVKIAPSLAKSHSLYGVKNWLAVFAFGVLFGLARELADVGEAARRAGISLTDFLAADHPSIVFLRFVLLAEAGVVVAIYWLLFTRSPHLRKAASALLLLSWPLIAMVGVTTQGADVGEALALSMFPWIFSCAVWVSYLNISRRVRVTFENLVIESDSILSRNEPRPTESIPGPPAAVASTRVTTQSKPIRPTLPESSSLRSDAHWEAALLEFESDSRRKGLWAKCFANANGDESRAKAMYLMERAGEISHVSAAERHSPLPRPIEAQPRFETLAERTKSEGTATEMGDPTECQRKLVAIGCRVFSPSEGVWEILHPSGITAFARSPEALQGITYHCCPVKC
jgi:Protein of unknown function (DUF2569)